LLSGIFSFEKIKPTAKKNDSAKVVEKDFGAKYRVKKKREKNV